MSGINEDASNATLYVCVKPFNARLGDELNLQVGDKIEVLADDSEYNDGWYMGRNIASHEVGLYPKLFTQPIKTANPSHTLLRSRSRRVMRPNDANQNPSAKLNKIANAMQNVSLSSDVDGDAEKDETVKKPLLKDTPSNSVNRTMNDINKALQELQGSSDKGVSDSTPKADQEEDVFKTHHNRNYSDISTGDSLNPSEVTSWTPQQVSSYFNTILGFDSDVSGKFTLHKITGAILLELDLGHLKELDIDTFGTRFEISKEIGKLKRIASSKNVNHKYSKKDGEKGARSNPVERKALDALSDISYEDLRSPNISKTSSPFKMNSTKTNSDEETNNTSYSRNNGQGNLSAKFTSSTPSKNVEVDRTSRHSLNQYPDADISTKEEDPSVLFSRRAHSVSKESREADNEYNGDNDDEKPRARENDNTLTGRPTSSIYEGKNRKEKSSKDNVPFSLDSGRKRRSSLFLFESENNNRQDIPLEKQDYVPRKGEYKSKDGTLKNEKRKSQLLSPTGDNYDNFRLTAKYSSSESENLSNSPVVEEDIDNAYSPHKLKSISYRGGTTPKRKDAKDKRVVSESTVSRLKNFTTNSTQNFRNFTTLKKLKTSAFTEGIQEITPDEAIKTATFSGWMAKKSTNNLGWKSRYFTLHGTRLLYFTSLKDRREKGLIDITAHKVVPISSNGDGANANEKYLAMYAASAGFGRFCFKLVPPAPGFRKGLTFTEPKTHYFTVDTQEDMRGWIKSLMTSTIDIDDSAPVISSCSTPTVSLGKAQELLEQAREENKARDMELEPSLEELSKQEEAFTRLGAPFNVSKKSASISEENSSAGRLTEDNTPNQQVATPKLSVDTKNVKRTPSQSQFGFSSPYLLASGVLSPKLANSGSSPSATPILNNHSFDAVIPEKADGKIRNLNQETESKKAKKKSPEKMLAYSNDGSGNHTFVIKQKK